MLQPDFTRSDVPLTTMRDMVRGFANAMNLIDPEVEDHHEKVCYLALQIACAMDFSEKDCLLTFYGALLHDVGLVASSGKSLLELEHTAKLAKAGGNILRSCAITSFLSDVVEVSQTPWEKMKHTLGSRHQALLIPQVIHLADIVSLLLKNDEPALNQLPRIRACVDQLSGTEVHPAVKQAFDRICHREIVWMDLLYRPQVFLEYIPAAKVITLDEAQTLTAFMSRIIDFRSPFTAMHSAGVAASAVYLARLLGMNEAEQKMMRIAGHLHDIGKLKIPTDILEKPGKLTDEEFNIMKEHAFYTYMILKDIRGFEQIAAWAAYHHEKLHGEGYPFHLAAEEISLGSRIMAVADVFSAITEDRPYRRGMNRAQAMDVLQGDADRGALSPAIVELVASHYEEINLERELASRDASSRYQQMLAEQEDGSTETK